MEQPDVIITRLKRKLRNRRTACRQMNKAVQFPNGRIAVLQANAAAIRQETHRLHACADQAERKIASLEAKLAWQESREASTIPAATNLSTQQQA